MERLVGLAFWLLVVIVMLGTLPWLLAQLSAQWIVVLLVAVGAGLAGRYLRQRRG